ncbi:[histone H3]-dimethyl-L-lysine(36) demethylase [Malassezia cuniculi]|uniref:[histone H3]-dimethyl-L-lysine(36) demethylase n=1 Tax=Malassezia cuniculi TaxID=948313 RepID=A0AAF0EWY8_9BASI|nr:[histone H3]-dimethyl-L-lysine(36) demethylase [Malassezia cuniculi]
MGHERSNSGATTEPVAERAPAALQVRAHAARLLSEMAPNLMTQSMVSALAHAGATRDIPLQRTSLLLTPRFMMDHPARSLARIGMSLLRFSGITDRESRNREPATSADVRVLEESQRLLATAAADLVEAGEDQVSLLRGFHATAPESRRGKARRRRVRADIVEKEGPRKAIESRQLSLEELEREDAEIAQELENLSIRRTMCRREIESVDAKIAALQRVRETLEEELVAVRDEELELQEEREGVASLLDIQRHRRAMPGGSALDVTESRGPGRGRHGALFLPSEHDELPPGVAFMTLKGHTSPITALDFSEPYGTLVSSSVDDAVRVWDLSTGEQVGSLDGHKDTVGCLQVEDELCVSGSADNTVRIWDLRRVRQESPSQTAGQPASSQRASGQPAGEPPEDDSDEQESPCVRTLSGHSKSVTALYFRDGQAVTGANDKTLRQWDLETGQCILTMDILWALSNAVPVGDALDAAPDTSAAAYNGPFSYAAPPYEDGSWEMYTDFVGGVQFWGCALASGSADGGVRMWDLRTGQAHRTLVGHTAPVTALQFDDTYVVSGSLDKSVRVWDLRTGNVLETIKYDYPVTSLQFDSRRIVAAVGTRALDVYSRTAQRHSPLAINGHASPAER